MKIAVGNSRTATKWRNQEITWEQFCERVKHTQRTTETVEEYTKLDKATRANIKDVGGFVGGALKDGRRKGGMVLCRSMLTLDMDYATPDIWDTLSQEFPYRCCVYSTHKHTPQKPRLRLVIPLSREISEEEYPAVARMVAYKINMDLFDDTTYQPARLMYWPSTSQDGKFFFQSKEGPLLDPDSYLSMYTDWKDISSWPVSSRQTELIHRAVKRQADPLKKPGLIGAFCRAYSIQDAVETFLTEVYESSGTTGRYHYLPADSCAGMVVYDGKFAFSHHATDPACGKLLNSFDLVRLHRFGKLDRDCPGGTSISKRPSFQAMKELAKEDERVKILLARERAAQVKEDFSAGDWQMGLELNDSGGVKSTLKNLILILKNDPALKSLVFNQLSDSIEIHGEVPWKHPSQFWRDADDAQLVSYIDANYGHFSGTCYNTAVTKVADDRSYHPIRNFLKNLPTWDGIPRVETLLVDYLGAEDTPYVRAVTRKTLCAAVNRVLHPGCKFDCMLVLNGPQGIGKSTLIAKLAGEWFSDSLNLGDTKDKTAAEKLQGYWILEIGELAGLRKAEVETLRSFLSRQNDIYRAAFGRRATPHLRQCIFFGTTNAQSGYLQDVNGNRRFWPVKTPGGGKKHSWDITQEEIQQIWAETLTYVEQGESLYLEGELGKEAQSRQLEAMEADERAGLVQEYLETPLPDNWDAMDLVERRNYLSNLQSGKITPGTVQREAVSNIEIWCECFCKERSDLNRKNSNELTKILTQLGWTKQDVRKRIPLYGPQWLFVPEKDS